MDATAHARLKHLPNALTVSRLVLTPVVCALIMTGWFFTAAVVFTCAVATDWFDGYAARRLGVTSSFGRVVDPLADKLLVLGALIELLAVPRETGLSPWMVTVILAREFIVQTLRSLIEGQGEPFGARMAGKLKATLQFVAIIVILVELAYPPNRPWRLARDLLIWAALILTVYSGVGYIRIAWPKLFAEPTK